jgi:cytochrome c oxidase cbb3-type subunit III
MSETPLPEGQLTGHEYDGITEFDNPIPGWWSWIFFASVVFSVLYYMAYQLGTAGTSVQQAYDNALTANLRLQFEEIGTLTPDEPTILKYINDTKWLPVGRKVFEGNCASCHGKDGEGLVGPNMTDDHYKNIKRIGDFATVIQHGAANGAMPAWQNRLHPNEIVMVAAYVASLRGQNKEGRQPEGDVIPPWPQAPPPSPESSTDAPPDAPPDVSPDVSPDASP